MIPAKEIIKETKCELENYTHRGPYCYYDIKTPNGKKFCIDTSKIKGVYCLSLSVRDESYVITPNDITMERGYLVFKYSSCVFIPKEKIIEILKLN